MKVKNLNILWRIDGYLVEEIKKFGGFYCIIFEIWGLIISLKKPNTE